MSVFQALFNPLQQIFDKLTFHLILTITRNKTKTEFVQIWWELKALFVTFTAYYIEKKDKTIHYRLRLPLLSLARNDFLVSPMYLTFLFWNVLYIKSNVRVCVISLNFLVSIYCQYYQYKICWEWYVWYCSELRKTLNIFMLAPTPLLDQTITYYYVHPSLLPCYNTVYQILTEQTNVVST